MPLTEAAFTELVNTGCLACGSKKVSVETYVAQKLPLLGGEIYGSPSWGYKGEDLVRGTFRLACGRCDHPIFESSACPRCDAPDMLEKVMLDENTFPLPVSCTGCGSELVTATAFVPATVIYEGKRAAPARTQTAPDDPGFHAFRAECKSCRNASEQRTPCPLCSSP